MNCDQLKAIVWTCAQGRWAAPVRLRRDGRIGNQMRGVVLGHDGATFLFSFDQLVGYMPQDGQLVITSKKFRLPDAILEARKVQNPYGKRLARRIPEHSMTTERHKHWFYFEFDGIGDHKPAFIDGDLFDRTIARLAAVPTANFGRESRYGV